MARRRQRKGAAPASTKKDSQVTKGRPHSYLVVIVTVLAVANLYFETLFCGTSQPEDQNGAVEETRVFDSLSKSTEVVNNASIARNVTSPHDEISKMLPDKLFVIYGLESSGTTFTAKALCSALGIQPILNPDTAESKDKRIHIHHISLPLGAYFKERWVTGDPFTKPLHVAPVYYPTGCRVPPFKDKPPEFRKTKPECQEIMGDKVMADTHRYMVNITSHVQWYRNFGVQVFPIMVVRDPSFHFKGILKQHCTNPGGALVQYEQGRNIMFESMDSVEPTIVSYEAMMTLQSAYMKDLYRKLNITTSYMPKFQDGNVKYAPPETTPKMIHQKLNVRPPPVRNYNYTRVARPPTRPALNQNRAFLPGGVPMHLSQGEDARQDIVNHTAVSGSAAGDAKEMNERLQSLYRAKQQQQQDAKRQQTIRGEHGNQVDPSTLEDFEEMKTRMEARRAERAARKKAARESERPFSH